MGKDRTERVALAVFVGILLVELAVVGVLIWGIIELVSWLVTK